MKKKTIPAQKLKLNKERIASLTENYTKAVLGGWGGIKAADNPGASNVAANSCGPIKK